MLGNMTPLKRLTWYFGQQTPNGLPHIAGTSVLSKGDDDGQAKQQACRHANVQTEYMPDDSSFCRPEYLHHVRLIRLDVTPLSFLDTVLVGTLPAQWQDGVLIEAW